jgi:hypothetical protein
VMHVTEVDLPSEPIEQIRNLAQGIINGLNASRDRVETAFSALALAAMDHASDLKICFDDAKEVIGCPSQAPSDSQSSVVSVSDVDRVDAHLHECVCVCVCVCHGVHVTCVNQPTVAGAVCGSHMTHARSKSVFSVTVCLRMRTEVFVTLFLT